MRLADITRVVFVVVVAPPLNEHEDSENDDDLMRRAFNPVKEADILSDEEAQVFFAEIQTKTRGEDIRRHATTRVARKTKNDKKTNNAQASKARVIFFFFSLPNYTATLFKTSLLSPYEPVH